MIARNLTRIVLSSGVALGALATPALAQDAPDITNRNAQASEEGGAIVVTGSRIKQDPTKSALPLQIITTADIERAGISSAEQLNMFLTSSGSGADNLASNSDVTSGAQRGTNGLSAANLRGQGSAATLVLLNGRRVAAHGLSGQAVDVNQIPFAAIDRVEVLKDGASAIYGTDAVGGVINYITKKNYTGLGVQGFTDITQRGDGNIYRLSGVAGYGDLDEQGFNIMGAVAYSWNQILQGSSRDFVNGNQPERGLSIDTRGTPLATVFNIGNNAIFFPTGTLTGTLTLTAPNGGNAAAGGINILDLPGGAGCGTMDGGMAYDEQLWSSPNNIYACAWDTGRAAALQQPINTLTYYAKGTVKLGASEAYVEVTGSDADSAKSFSHNQLSTNTGNLPIAYPLNSLTAATYNTVFNAIRGALPACRAGCGARCALWPPDRVPLALHSLRTPRICDQHRNLPHCRRGRRSAAAARLGLPGRGLACPQRKLFCAGNRLPLSRRLRLSCRCGRFGRRGRCQWRDRSACADRTGGFGAGPGWPDQLRHSQPLQPDPDRCGAGRAQDDLG